jgi:hypothetical protein
MVFWLGSMSYTFVATKKELKQERQMQRINWHSESVIRVMAPEYDVEGFAKIQYN